MRVSNIFWGSCLLLGTVEAAYVQHRRCEGSEHDATTGGMTDISVWLKPSEKANHDQVSWSLSEYIPTPDCEARSAIANLTMSFTIDLLGSSSKYYVRVNTSCSLPASSSLKGLSLFRTSASHELDQLYPLSTFHSTIAVLESDTNVELLCRQVNVTPAIDRAFSTAFQWTPVAIFLFVLLVEVLHMFHPSGPAAASTDEDESDEANPAVSQPVLLNVSDCFNYLQFIFLSGSLSLFYPGFYMPIVSHLAWTSLLYGFSITSDYTYPSITDGIYEINGTYGGSYGLEVMHQIVGAPSSMRTWLNMVLAIAAIAIACVFLRVCTRFVRRHFSSTIQLPASNDQNDPGGFASWVVWVLRIIFSYFLMPLATFSFYQFDNARFLPLYHTALSAGVLVVVLSLFAWSLWQIPIRTMGQLIFDTSKRYQRLAGQEDGSRATYDTTFIWILFTLLFIRGAAIGGLQIFPLAQLSTLICCEVVLLISIYSFQAYSLFSISTISALVRLLSLALMVPFVPGLTNRNVRSAIGYSILLIHTWMLILGFLCPAVYRLCRLWAIKSKEPRPDAYGLRQLDRRHPSDTNISPRMPSALSHRSLVSPYPQSPREWAGGDPRDPVVASPVGDSSEFGPFFRAPRHSSSTRRFVGSDFRSSSSQSTRDTASSLRPHSPKDSSSVSRTDGSSYKGSEEDELSRRSNSSASMRNANHIANSTENSSREESSDCGTTNSRPLGPRWNDYSFRESDLFFKSPKPRDIPSWGNEAANIAIHKNGQQSSLGPESTHDQPLQSPTIRTVASGVWSTLKSKGKSPASAPVERGFHVSRPGNPAMNKPGSLTPPPNQ